MNKILYKIIACLLIPSFGETKPLTVNGKLKDELGGTPIKGQACVRVLKAVLLEKNDVM